MNNLLSRFEEDRNYIETYPLETTEGTQKVMHDYHVSAINALNAFIEKRVLEYTELKEKIFQELKRRKDEVTPVDTSDNYKPLLDKINIYKTIIKYDNPYNNVYEKLDFDKIVNNIGDVDTSNLTKVNTLIGKVIELFNQANIPINASDFDYTVYSKKYMQVYFDSKDKDTFKDDILAVFNQLYWECPDLTTHIAFSIRGVYTKYSKELETYFNGVKENLFKAVETTPETYLDDYNKLNAQLEDEQRLDPYLLSNKFINGELAIADYMPGSKVALDTLNKFLTDTDFNSLTEEQKEFFFVRIRNLKYVVTELNHYNKYKEILKDIIERYNKKDTYKGVLQTKAKEVEKEEKEIASLYSQYNKKDKKFLFFGKKVNRALLKVQTNEKVKKIYTLYDELSDAYINEIIMSKLDDTSTVNDALKVCASFYWYFKSLSHKVETEQEDFNYIQEFLELNDFVYDIDNAFILKVKFLDESDITNIIVDKYKLLNINLTKEDLTDNIQELDKSIDFINQINNINKSAISLENIKFIVDFQKIEKNQ